METKDIIIIGGGAAGLMASCAAAHVLKKRGSVLVLEGNAKLGRKLLATGNGRCNLTNLNVSPAHYHGDVTAIQDLLHEYTPEAICAVFREMGLVTKADSEGRVYPQNQQAAAVLSALRWDAEKYGVSFSEEHTVSKIEKVKNGFTLICTDGTQLFTKQWKTLSGTRAPANAVLLADGKPVYKESGEVQFTDTGISGICVFGLSVYAGEFFALGTIRNKKYASLAVQLDLLPDMAYQDVLDYLLEMTKLYPARAAGDLLSGLLNMRLGYMLVGAAGIAQSEPAVKIKAPQLKKLASLLKGWRLDITGTKDFSAAQVTAGGVPLTELDPHTMASKQAPGLYLAGEMLNIHGDCGGYNLHFAWASGITAGKSAAYRCLKEEKR
ncbi:NAD(P)/FAD-dependent oxidoreductase [Hominenteromicrobium sp.]|uniref:NAD(P)/FAD-dependent oxidoreductase n=1 Tax=Hominenteromicrobium sp. TaxID=3073581 RepID=UPI003AF8510D